MTDLPKTEARVALVTGAASGIGRACAEALAGAGLRIAANYRSQHDNARAMLTSLPGDRHHLLQADISDPEQAAELVTQTLAHFGRIDVLVNAAGHFSRQQFEGDSWTQWQAGWQQSLNTNLLAGVNLCWLVAQHLRERRAAGRIINITSRGAFRGEPNAPAYGAAKAALNAFSQSMAAALAPQGVCVYAIAPGWVATPQAGPRISPEMIRDIPLGRVGEPEEIAALVRFLACERAEYLTGAIFDANGASYLRG